MESVNKSPDSHPGVGEDAHLASLLRTPYTVAAPQRQLRPFVFSSPHSGRIYPQDFLSQARLSATDLRRSEDAYVDELLAGVVTLGAPVISARFPRAYVDANRAPTELDPSMFAGPLGLPYDASSPRVVAGLGVIPRLVRDGAEIYRGKLRPGEARDRIFRLHQPYHAELNKLAATTLASFQAAVVVDCHSMPSVGSAPDIVLGDRYGTAATHFLVRRAEQTFSAMGFKVARNVPYAGGFTTGVHGRPGKGFHAIQVEINRALYLDEERVVPNAQFDTLASRLLLAFSQITAIDPALLKPPSALTMAAE